MKIALICGVMLVGSLVAALAATEDTEAAPPMVPFPEGYRTWQHVSSGVLKPRDVPTAAAPHGLMGNIYANAKAVDGYRTGHFPEGAVLAVDWFVIQARGPQLLQGPRKSVNVMVRDPRFTETGGWGFEDFNEDSRTERNVGSNAVQACFQCHTAVRSREYVFSELKP